MSKHPLTMVLRSLALIVLAALVSCGGGGVVPGGADVAQLRPLPTEYLRRKAVNYGYFRTWTPSTEVVTDANLLQDMNLLVQGNFTLIRVFYSDANSQRLLQVIRDNNLDIKVQLGCWMFSEEGLSPAAALAQEQVNQTNIANCIAQANAFPDIVLAVSVGNECMVSWTGNPIPPAQMAGYITQVRNGVSQPVTTDDDYAFWNQAPANVLAAVDFIALHVYSFSDTGHGLWDWKQTGVIPELRAQAMMAAGLAREQANYASARDYLAAAGYGALPIVITETGWKSAPSQLELFRAHPVNTAMFYNLVDGWRASGTGPKNVFWFEAFDEPFKNTDDKWGLFNVSRQARYIVSGLYPSSIWEPGTAGYTTPGSALYYLPPMVNPAVTAGQYTLYAEKVTSGEARPGAALAWTSSNATAAPDTTTAAEGTASMLISPTPNNTINWGITLGYANPPAGYGEVADNLSAFAGGYLNFSIKTTYAGRLMVGYSTGNFADLSEYSEMIPIGNGNYGYYNDGAWHQVKIPVADIVPWGGIAWPCIAPYSFLDNTNVTGLFTIGDTYAVTGNAPWNFTPINVDDIYWSK